MRLLLDANLSWRVAELLRGEGFEAVHVRERAMQHAEDARIRDLAVAERRILVSEDTDFAALLAYSGRDRPSLVLLRSGDPLTPDEQARRLVDTLPGVEADLASGAIVVIERMRLRVRHLPISGEEPIGGEDDPPA